jgi:TatD DNase family protein
MFIDSHAHLDFKDYKEDFSSVLDRAKEAKVSLILNIGTTLQHSRESLEVAKKHDHIYSSVGIHPHDVKDLGSTYIDELRTLAKHPKVKAIGEIGLDYFYKNSDPALQKKCLEEQLLLAKDLNLPVSIHCRDAFKEAFEILDRVGLEEPKGVFHCFTGTKEEANQALERGFYISISGIVTFKKATALQEVVKELPLDKMLIETDCPFLAPEPYRGKRNEPSYVVKTAEKIAALQNKTLEEVAQQTTQNAVTLFNLAYLN